MPRASAAINTAPHGVASRIIPVGRKRHDRCGTWLNKKIVIGMSDAFAKAL